MERISIDAYKQVFLRRINGVRSARVLFDYYIDRVDLRGTVRLTKDQIAAELNVSARTVANYIYTLCALDLIRRKYDGRTILNPAYYFAGDVAELDEIKREYADFRSDYVIKEGKTDNETQEKQRAGTKR